MITDVFEGHVCYLYDLVLYHEVRKLEVDQITLVGSKPLVFGICILPVHDFNLELDFLCPEILRLGGFGLQLVDISHSLDLCNGKVLPLEPGSIHEAVHDAHEQVRGNMLQ